MGYSSRVCPPVCRTGSHLYWAERRSVIRRPSASELPQRTRRDARAEQYAGAAISRVPPTTSGPTVLELHILSSQTGPLSPRMIGLIADLAQEWRRLDERIAAVSAEIEALAERDNSCQRLMTVPGVGPIISSAVAIGRLQPPMLARLDAWIGEAEQPPSRPQAIRRILSDFLARVVLHEMGSGARRPERSWTGLLPDPTS